MSESLYLIIFTTFFLTRSHAQESQSVPKITVKASIIRYISMPIKLAFTKDSEDYGFGTYWHFSIGLTGNLPIPLNE